MALYLSQIIKPRYGVMQAGIRTELTHKQVADTLNACLPQDQHLDEIDIKNYLVLGKGCYIHTAGGLSFRINEE